MIRAPASRSGVPSWVRDSVFYQIFPDRFASSRKVRKPGKLEPWDSPPTRHGFKGGDLLGIVERLDHIERLGANAIYLNPIFASASNHRYHTDDYERVDPLLGGDEALRTLLDAAHGRGIRVILDGVFNHSGRGFWPFHHLLENGPESPYRDWFLVRDWPIRAYGDGAPSYEAWWGLPALPKLNIANPETREYVLSAAERWTRSGIDGWRLDVPTEIREPGFWEEFRRRVRAINPEAYLVGEIWHEAPEWLLGDRFDGLMNYPFARLALGLASRSIGRRDRPGGFKVRRQGARAALGEMVRQLAAYRPEAVAACLNLLDSHDTPRFLTMAGGDHATLHLGALLQMTMPGVPCIYYGDEVGLEGEADPDCRRGFPWDRRRWHKETWEVFRRAVALRRGRDALRRGEFVPLLGRAGVIAFLRRTEEEILLVALNVTEFPARALIPLPPDVDPGRRPRELWARARPGIDVRPGKGGAADLRLELAPRSGSVLDLAPR
jgi:cyclomaltodextrinase / maltogenic alpha-amylase / neopullulanase